MASLIHPQNSSSQKSSSPAYPSAHKPKLLHLQYMVPAKLPPANLQLSCNSKQKNGAQNAKGKKKIEERRKEKLKALKEQRVEHDGD